MSIMKSGALFCFKSVVFSAIFWGLWIGVIRPMTTAPQAANTQNTQSSSEMQAYEEQLNRTNRMLDISEDQQRRMDQYLTSQEENAKRFDAVLKVWEKQAGIGK